MLFASKLFGIENLTRNMIKWHPDHLKSIGAPSSTYVGENFVDNIFITKLVRCRDQRKK